MNNIVQAIWVELLKARRSRMPVLTALGYSMVPLMLGFFMIVLRDPEMARRSGLITTKAQITMGTADWPTYIKFMLLSTGAGGIILFGLIVSWVFGREYSDRTVKDLLALPTSRSAIVFAKFIVVAIWSAALIVLICIIGLAVGVLVGLDPVPNAVFIQGGIRIAITALLTIALMTPIGFFASAGHGYLPPIGIMILVMALAQVSNTTGRGEYFPWAIPGLYSQGEVLGTISFVIVILTCLVGIAATFGWWEFADQTR